jgi:rhodanese-related sulfurtransferase
MNFPEITVQEFSKKLKSDDNFIILDVREPWELDRAKFSDKRMINIPLSVLAQQRESALSELLKNPEAEIIVSCHHGPRSADVTRWLIQLGYKNVKNLEGGIAEYAHVVDKSVGMY